MRRWGVALLVALAALGFCASASAEFPYTRPAGDPADYTDLYLGAGQVPGDLGGNEFKFAATPDPANVLNNLNPVELGGVRGAHVVDDDAGVDTAFMTTTGRPDVTIAILDSGIEWNDTGAMQDIRFKTRLSKGELEKPENDGLGTPNEPGEDCSAGGPYTNTGEWDLNEDGVFNLLDYACDGAVQTNTPKGVGPAGLFEPQDVLIAFSNGSDDDDNGYVDDIVGWDFLDDDNDPFDDVQYGHGTGEARDSTAETDNGGDAASCPNCMGIHLRVGDSFIADVNRFGQAVTYAADNDVQVVQEALGTLNNSSLARDAVNYAYRHGVVVMASAADEAAQHNNWPSTLPHTIVTNSVTSNDPVPVPNQSFLAFNGCTNFSAKITVAIPSTACSSNAVGLAAGYAGLIYSAALNARDAGALDDYPDTSTCELTSGDPCPITPNEIRQLLASGAYGGTLQADDVNFAGTPPGGGGLEPSCSPAPLPGCTSPYGAADALRLQVTANRPSLLGGPVVSASYPAREGHDQFYGYGRANLNKAVQALIDDPAAPSAPALPPEAEIFSPEWFQQVDPADSELEVDGEVFARGDDYTCQLYVAPGQYPNNSLTSDSPPGDYAPVGNGWCDGATTHSGADAQSMHRGTLGTIDLDALESRFPPGTDFTGSIPQASTATGNGRPFFAPHAFTFKIVVTPASGPARTGEDQRSAYLHRDADLLDGYPKSLVGAGGIDDSDQPTVDGESSPAFADLDGDNRNELIFGGSDGFVHAIGPDGDELDGWPVRSDPAPFFANHTGSRAYESGEISTNRGGMFLASVAVGDPDNDGIPTVYGADYEGKVYGWAPDGTQVFEEEADPAFSGKPLAPFENVRQGKLNRTGHGFFGSPVLADLDGDGKQELVAAAMDRHVYAWETSDSNPTSPGGADQLDGYPVLVVDPAKVQSVDPTTHAVTYRPDADAKQQGAIIDTPAIADLTGDERPEIVIGTNEEYGEDPNASAFNAASLGAIAGTGILNPGNTRLFVIKPEGDTDGDPLPGDALVAGWPKAMALLLTELLPVVGEGVTGSPVIGPVNCPSGGSGNKIAAQSAAGPLYVFNPDGTSCYGEGPDGKDITLQTDAAASVIADHPILPAVGHPAFGNFGAGSAVGPAVISPAAGVIRAADLALPEYQTAGQDYIAAWDPSTGQFQPNFPQTMNDLQFLTGPSIADIDGLPGEELIAGSASQDFAAYTSAGTPVPGWPKLSTDWTVANPLIGSFGERETDGDAEQVVVTMTRSGYLNAYATDAPACSDASSPRFHHDNANSGDYSRDAVAPGRPMAVTLSTDGSMLGFTAPGDDLLCGSAESYEIVTSNAQLSESNFKDADPLAAPPAPEEAGEPQSYELPADTKRYVAIRAIDEQGNVGRVASVDLDPPGTPTDPDDPGNPDTPDDPGNPGDPTDPDNPTPPGPDNPDGPDGPNPGPAADCETEIPGTTGNDKLRGRGLGEKIYGRGGDDDIRGRSGNDCLFGNAGSDELRGQGGDDVLRGGSEADLLKGASGDDRLRGLNGKDRIKGGGGTDDIRGGKGRDQINAGAGDDVINARGGGRDTVRCGSGRDRVKAGKRDKVARNCEQVDRGR